MVHWKMQIDTNIKTKTAIYFTILKTHFLELSNKLPSLHCVRDLIYMIKSAAGLNQLRKDLNKYLSSNPLLRLRHHSWNSTHIVCGLCRVKVTMVIAS